MRSVGPRSLESKMVGLGRLELPTSRLSSARSNQLSYKPQAQASTCAKPPRAAEPRRGGGRVPPGTFAQTPARPRGLVQEERETKAAKSRISGHTGRLFQAIRKAANID